MSTTSHHDAGRGVAARQAGDDGLTTRNFATLKDLCREDKNKIAELMHKVHDLEQRRAEAEANAEAAKKSLASATQSWEAERNLAQQRIDSMRQQNQKFVDETAKVRSKCNKSMAYLKAYQEKLKQSQRDHDRCKEEVFKLQVSTCRTASIRPFLFAPFLSRFHAAERIV